MHTSLCNLMNTFPHFVNWREHPRLSKGNEHIIVHCGIKGPPQSNKSSPLCSCLSSVCRESSLHLSFSYICQSGTWHFQVVKLFITCMRCAGCMCSCAGSRSHVCRAGGGGQQHPEGSHPGRVDEEVLPQPQTVRKLRPWLPGATDVFTGDQNSETKERHQRRRRLVWWLKLSPLFWSHKWPEVTKVQAFMT